MASFACFRDESNEFLFDEDELREETTEQDTELSEFEGSLAESVRRDDRARLISLANQTHQQPSGERDSQGDATSDRETLDPGLAAKLLQLACRLDSAECARALIEGETGTVARVNEMDESGRTPLHIAAAAHSAKCVELLLSKDARTDSRSTGPKSLHALESALFSKRMQVEWSPNEPVDELLILLREMDLSTVRMLAERTRDVAEIAYTIAVGGQVIALAALLMLVADKVASLITIRGDCGAKRGTSVYESVLDEALVLWVIVKRACSGRTLSGSLRHGNGWVSAKDCLERRELLLREIELLQLFGAVVERKDNKVMPPLLRASQAGDEDLVKLLLEDVHVDANEIDADGNTSLHWCLKAGSSSQETRILWLLLKHGAIASRRNKLGLTPFHLAAEKGNYQALKVLLLHAPECLDIASETKETPLFLAVKNDFVNCVQLLLHYGANIQAFNIRRQRPIEVAKSQDMRFVLSQTNKGLWSRTLPSQETGLAYPSVEDLYQEIFGQPPVLHGEAFKNVSLFDSSKPNAKVGICHYYGSVSGCARRARCSYAHGEGEVRRAKNCLLEIKQGPSKYEIRYPIHCNENLEKKIFVGGLPPSFDSDRLRKFFEVKFGPVEEAVVIGMQEGNEVHSRGFGFIAFKQVETAASALEAHFVTILGKKVEIKTAVPKCTLLMEDFKTNLRDAAKGKPDAGGIVGSVSEQCPPPWLSKLKKWLPVFLKETTKWMGVGEWYPLSSLKGDFRATCGMELDHASLGFLKLSDFIRSLPGLCRMRAVPVEGGCASHMVLLPALPGPHDEQLPPASTPSTEQDLLAAQGGVPPQDDASATPAGSPVKPQEPSQSSPTSVLAADLSRILKCLLSEKDYFGSESSGGPRSNPPGRDTFTSSIQNPTDRGKSVFLGKQPMGRGIGGGGGTGGWTQPPQRPNNHEGGNERPFSFFERQWDHFLIERGSCIICKDREGSWAMVPCLHKVCGRCMENRTPRYCMICGAVVNGFNPWPKADGPSQSVGGGYRG